MRHLWSLHVSRIPFHTDLHPGRNVYMTSWFILSVLFLPGGEMSVVPTCVQVPPITRTSTPVGKSIKPAGSFCQCCYCQVVRCLWSLHMSLYPITQTSTPVGTSIQPAGSFCLCCFAQAVRHLCSLHVSRIPCHTDLNPVGMST